MMRLARNPFFQVFILALATRIGGQVFLHAYATPETWEYEDIALNLLNGHGYTYSILGTVYVASVASPLYVFLTAAVYAVTNQSHAAILVLQALLGASAAVLVALLAQRLSSRRAAWIAGGLAAVHPAFVVYAAKLHALSLDLFAFTALLYACSRLSPKPGARSLAVLGAFFGLTALTRSTVLFLVPVVLLWLWAFRGVRLRSPGALAFVAAAMIVFLPWSIRNSMLLGQPVLLSSESTEWLWRGNNPAATGSSWTADGQLMLDVAPPAFKQQVLDATESQRIGLYRDAALRFIAENPGQAAGLYLTKLKAFWWTPDSAGMLYPTLWLGAYLVWYSITLLLTLLGAWLGMRSARSRPEVLLIVASLLVVSMVQGVFYVEGRHRWAVEPLMLVLAGGGASWLFSQVVGGLRVWPRSRPRAAPRPAFGARRAFDGRDAAG